MVDLPGILPPSSATPGSAADIDDRVRHGHPGCVMRLRFSGVYLPLQILRDRPIVQGLVVSCQRDRNWSVDLYDAQGKNQLLKGLLQPVVRKQRPDGSMQMDGQEWDEGYLGLWPQTWLIARDPEAVKEHLQAMAEWLRARYTGKLQMP